MSSRADQSRSPSAVVIGGGIGGLAAALALRAAGWHVQVLEQSQRPAAVGAGISLWPNAVLALETIGVGLRDRASLQGAGGIRTNRGRWLTRTDNAAIGARYGAPLIAVHRAELHQALVAGLAPVTVTTGTRVTAIAQDEDGVTVRYSGGEAAATLVVLADGLSSATRPLVAGAAPRPRYAGYTAWRGVTQPGAGPDLDLTTESWGRGQRFGIVPLADGRIYWFATANVGEGRHAADGEHPGDGEHRAGEHEEVVRRFAGWHTPIEQVLAATAPASVLRHDIYDLRPDPTSYVRGRLVLLGDAAHAMTPNLGQGACQALEDAVTLGALLRPGAALGPALARYDALRRPRAQRIARRSRQVGRLGQLSSAAGATVRNLLMRITPDGVTERQLAAILRWRPPA